LPKVATAPLLVFNEAGYATLTELAYVAGPVTLRAQLKPTSVMGPEPKEDWEAKARVPALIVVPPL